MSEETTATREAPVNASPAGGENGVKAFRDKDAGEGGGKAGKRNKRRKVSYLTINKIDYVDYKDVPTLKKFINDRGKILSTKVTGCTAKQQRMITKSIKRAREMALIPFVVTEPTADRMPYKSRAPRGEGYTPRGDRGDREPRADAAPAAAPAAEE